MGIREAIESDKRTPDQRDAERDVRLLLHRVRKPDELATNPLAQALCGALGFSDPVAAVRRVVEETFAGDTPDDVALRNLVMKCDIDGSLTLSEACRQFAYSRRHFQRYRAQAIGAIAHFIRRLLDPSFTNGPMLNPLEGLADLVGDRDPAAATRIYDLEQHPIQAKGELQYLQARLRAAEAIDASNLRMFARVPEPLGLAIAAQSQELAGKTADVAELLSRLHYTVANSMGSFDPVTCYELEWLRFLQAMHRSDVFALDSSARTLTRLAKDRPGLRARSLLASGVALICQGNVIDASESIRLCALIAYQERSVARLATATVLQAQLELLRGNSEGAEVLASGAVLALGPHHITVWPAQLVVGRARMLQGKPWSPIDLSARPRASYDRIALEIALARDTLARGDLATASARARSCYQIAQSQGYIGLCAYAAATLMACAHANADDAETADWRIAAFTEFAKTGDHYLGVDLFMLPSTIDERIVDVLMERVEIIIPQVLSDTREQRSAARNLISRLCTYMVGSTHDTAVLDREIDAINASNSAVAHYFEKTSAMLEAMLGLNVSALLPLAQRASAKRCLTEAMHVLESRIHPGEKRLFLVG